MTLPIHQEASQRGSDRPLPRVKSFGDLAGLWESYTVDLTKLLSVSFAVINDDEEVFYGIYPSKSKHDLTIEDCNAALRHIADDELYPEVPSGVNLTLAPDELDDRSAFVKRPGLHSLESVEGTGFIPRQILDETLIMETISKSPHPNFIRYYGCRVKRGRITSLLLERLECTLSEYVTKPEFQQLDRNKFCDELESAVEHLHGLGLAHNDISPLNIMVAEGRAKLIDFGSCAPYGKTLQSLGSPGWREENFSTSEKKHDEYSLRKIREWIQDPQDP
ncbi:hypothetical protein CDD83_6519 [Cordyceps sp. RAO-2017]|nr:hypothetical protein CDD83_6519 [Cordyceps sp. RAO-2017]